MNIILAPEFSYVNMFRKINLIFQILLTFTTARDIMFIKLRYL